MNARLAVLTLACILGLASPARSEEQHPSPKTYLVEVSLLSPLFGTYNAYFFLRVAPTVALGAIAGYSRTTASDDVTKGTGFNAGLELNWFLTGSAIASGWRIVPSLRYVEDNYTHGSGTGKVSGVDFGLEGGYRWVWDCGLTAGLSAGIAFNSFGKQATLSDGYVLDLKQPLQLATGVSPIANISVGYAF